MYKQSPNGKFIVGLPTLKPFANVIAMLHVVRDNVTQEQEDPWLPSLRIPCKNGYISTYAWGDDHPGK